MPKPPGGVEPPAPEVEARRSSAELRGRGFAVGDAVGARGPHRRHSFFFVPNLERAWTRFGTSRASYTPRITLYRTPGRSGLRPGRTSTVWCSWMFECSPGIDAVTSYPVFSRTRQQTRLPEFGLRGSMVKTRRTVPRTCALPASSLAWVPFRFPLRPLRTSWLIVGIVHLRGSSLRKPRGDSPS